MSASTFKSVRNTAYNSEWLVGKEYTADKELSDSGTLITLRRRSRQLIKDNPIVAGMQQGFVNAIGSPNKLISVSENKLKQKDVQTRLDEFYKDCTVNKETLFSTVEILESSSFGDGDIIVSLPLDKSREEGKQTVIDLIEAQRVRTPASMLFKLSNGDIPKVRNGVEYDSKGKIKGYWVKKYSKMDQLSNVKENFDFYPVERDGRVVTRLFKSPVNARPNMSRQYPILTPAMTLLKHLDDYIEAVVIGARVAACYAGFVTSQNPARAWKSMTSDGDGGVNTDPQDGNNSRRVTKLFPGMISYLRPNEKIDFASPNKPSDNQDAFIVRLCKQISMLLRIPYEILFLDLGSVNYSSWRGGANERKTLIRRWRNGLEDILQWVLDTVIEEGMIFDHIRNTGDYHVKIRWPTYSILDPEKEARANALDLKNLVTTPQRICEERGVSFNEVNEELIEVGKLKVDRVSEILVYIRDKEKELGIEIPLEAILEGVSDPAKDTRETEKRPGESKDLTDEEKEERRKQDGNF